jgi:DNA polymerase alpha subunit B
MNMMKVEILFCFWLSGRSGDGAKYSKKLFLKCLLGTTTKPQTRPHRPPSPAKDAPAPMADVVEVARAFAEQGFPLDDDSDVAATCLAICRQFQAEASDLATSWDSFYTSNAFKVSPTPTAAAMEAFRAHFERHVAASRSTASKGSKTPQAFRYGKPDLLESLADGGGGNAVEDAMEVDGDASLAAVTPGRGGHTPGAKTSAARAAHAQATRVTGVQLPRADAGAALAAMAPAPGASAYAKRPAPRAAKTELNPALPKQRQTNDARSLPAAVKVVNTGAGSGAGSNPAGDGSGLERDVRYMRDRISDKVDMLETRLSDFAAEVEKAYPGISCGGAVYAASQDDVTVVGRVVCDSEGRLNEASVQLEGEEREGKGAGDFSWVRTNGGWGVSVGVSSLQSSLFFPPARPLLARWETVRS